MCVWRLCFFQLAIIKLFFFVIINRFWNLLSIYFWIFGSDIFKILSLVQKQLDIQFQMKKKCYWTNEQQHRLDRFWQLKIYTVLYSCWKLILSRKKINEGSSALCRGCKELREVSFIILWIFIFEVPVVVFSAALIWYIILNWFEIYSFKVMHTYV